MTQAYGPSITQDLAKKAAAEALAEARALDITIAVAIVDIGSHLVYFERMDDTQTGSVNVAIAKARSAALFQRSTKTFQDVLGAGGDGLRVLGLEGAVPIEGGLPLTVASAIVGAIGVSGGGTNQQEGQCAHAGADAIER